MQPENKKQRRGSNWLGIIVFLLVVVGPTLWRILSRALSGAGFALPGNLPLAAWVVGAIVVVVAISVAVQGLRRLGGRSDSRLPTSLPTQVRPPLPGRPTLPQQRANTPMPPFGGGGEVGPLFPNFPVSVDLPAPTAARATQLPRPPSFEPVISGKALLAALALFGTFGAAYLLAAAVLP